MQLLEHFLRGHRQREHARAARVVHRVRHRRADAGVRELADGLRAEGAGAGRIGEQHDPQGRSVGDRRQLVVAEVRRRHAPVLDAKLLHERLPQPEDEPALELPARRDRVDDRPDVSDEDGVEDPEVPRVAIDLDLQGVRVYRVDVRVTGVLGDDLERRRAARGLGERRAGRDLVELRLELPRPAPA